MPKTATKSTFLYDVHPGVAMAQKWIIELKPKTGRSLEEWIALVKKEGDSPERYLATAVRYVEEQYSGRKAAMRPVFEQLLALGKALGPDVKACPCKTMVPLYRNHVFAQIKPTTNTRIDFGLCFTTYSGRLPKRLIDTGGLAKKDRITHRIEVSSADQIDDDLKKWLCAAYDLDR